MKTESRNVEICPRCGSHLVMSGRDVNGSFRYDRVCLDCCMGYWFDGRWHRLALHVTVREILKKESDNE